MREAFSIVATSVAIVAVLVLLFIGGGFLGLWWYPYAIQRQTEIVRQSNSYVTTKQEEMLTLVRGYTQATDDGQRKAIVAELCQDAATIPNDVPPLAASVIAGRCGQ